MKQHLILVGIMALLLSTCGSGSKSNTPESTFEALVAAIKARDLEAYTQCWYPARAEQEGQVDELKTNDDMWEELDEMFKGPLKLEAQGERSSDGNTIKKFHVDSPEVEDGIGAISMIKVGDRWLMYSW